MTFTTLPSPPPGAPGGTGAGAPYESKEEPWVEEGAKREAEEAPRLGAEEKAKAEREAKEAAEAKAREAEGGQAIEERERRRQAELSEAHAREAAAAVQCVVPSLRGDSLKVAKKALGKAHCKLGKVSRPRRHEGNLVVTGLGRRVGARLPGGTAVAIKLGSVRTKGARATTKAVLAG